MACRRLGWLGLCALFPWKKLTSSGPEKERAIAPDDRAVQILINATTKWVQPQATSVTDEGWGRKFPSSTTKKTETQVQVENSIAHHSGPNSPTCLPPSLQSSQAKGYKRCRHNNDPNRGMAYLQSSQRHLQHPGPGLQKAPFCAVRKGDFRLTVPELGAGVCSVLAENCKSL